MKNEIKQITETDWGLQVVMKEGVVIDNDNLLPIMEDMLVHCKKIGKQKIFLDASHVIRKVTPVIFVELGELMEKLGCAHFKIAFFAPQYATHENSKLMENIGFNRGIFVKYFRDKEEAEKWLLE